MTDDEEDWGTEAPADFPIETGLHSEHEAEVGGELAHSVEPHDAHHFENGHQEDAGSSSEHIHDFDDVRAGLKQNIGEFLLLFVLTRGEGGSIYRNKMYLSDAGNAQKEEAEDEDGRRHDFLLAQWRVFVVDAGQAKLHQGKLFEWELLLIPDCFRIDWDWDWIGRYLGIEA